jgi:hypothetical protein
MATPPVFPAIFLPLRGFNRSFYFRNGFLSQKRHACGEAHKAFRTLNENSNGSPNGN